MSDPRKQQSWLVRFLRAVFFVDILKGLALTLKYFVGKPITQRYPEERPVLPERYRGLHQLRRYQDGSERCVACGLCAAVCPSECIYIEPAENELGQRYPKVWDLELLRCIFCGFCQEVCPFDAVVLTGRFELADYERARCFYTKDRLLAETGTGERPKA